MHACNHFRRQNHCAVLVQSHHRTAMAYGLINSNLVTDCRPIIAWNPHTTPPTVCLIEIAYPWSRDAGIIAVVVFLDKFLPGRPAVLPVHTHAGAYFTFLRTLNRKPILLKSLLMLRTCSCVFANPHSALMQGSFLKRRA